MAEPDVQESDREQAPADRHQPSQRSESAQSNHGVPSEGAVVSDRFSSDEIFQRIIAAAEEEIREGRRELFFSALAGGMAITITFLVYASLYGTTGGDPILSAILYPIGFIYIILGGYQLYTENTLPPVALTLERLASVPALFRNWGVVALGNFTGGALGAIALAYTGVLSPEAADAAITISQKGVDETFWNLFVKGAFAGLVVAGVVWVEYAARDTISRLAVIYLAFLCIPLGNLYHSVVSFTEMVYLFLHGNVGLAVGMFDFVVPVFLGNTAGGVILVTVVNYYQTSEHRLGQMGGSRRISRLTSAEWLFGRWVGRSYVPLLDTHEATIDREAEGERILVPISNPRTESGLVELAYTYAAQQENASVHLVHIVTQPANMRFQSNVESRQRIIESSERQMERYRSQARAFDIEPEISTVVTHDAFEEIFHQGKRDAADLVVMGWDDDKPWDTVKRAHPIEELTGTLPCKFLVLKDRGLDVSDVLLATAGGPDSDLSADVAKALRDAAGANISLLHVVDGPEERDDGEAFLREWAGDRGLDGAEIIIDDSGDVEGVIEREAANRTLVMLGASERGMLARLASNSLHLDVVNTVECCVLLAETPYRRPLRKRLFGRK